MKQPDYRYFLGFRPEADLRCWLGSLADLCGQHKRRVGAANFHLTLCVIAELAHRDRFIASRVASAIAGHDFYSCPFWLGRLRGGRKGAAVYAMGQQGEIQALYRTLLTCLAERNILPLYRKSGLRPHFTLGYDPFDGKPIDLPREWIPDALLLIESEVGRGVHNVLARWPLLPPRQGAFTFFDACENPPRLAPVSLGRNRARSMRGQDWGTSPHHACEDRPIPRVGRIIR
jgi:2'-5' RNA ligase